MTSASRFLFVCCQAGAETACKRELAARYPALKLAFSRPGFITFKCDEEVIAPSFQLVSTLARTWGWSLGKATGTDAREVAVEVARLGISIQPQVIHCWQRDSKLPGDDGFEPGPTPLAVEAGRVVAEALNQAGGGTLAVNRRAKPHERVLDVVLVEPDQWWLGWHVADTIAQTWPGGVPEVELTEPLVSRAWLKLCEAVLWGQVPLRAGDIALELGSAPGGAAQYLLQRGLKVIAVDPAEMDEAIAGHEHLHHIRRRAREVPNRELAGVRWLLADINMPPQYTLDVLEDYIQQRQLPVRGVIATLKLPEWELLDGLETIRERVRGWGFGVVRTRQLAFNRREFCLVALRNRFERRMAALSDQTDQTAPADPADLTDQN
jgi:23S rRNA (cytidine2498-2'-O)-methyltransferase